MNVASSHMIKKFEKKQKYKYGPQPDMLSIEMDGNIGSLWNQWTKQLLVTAITNLEDLPLPDLTMEEVSEAVRRHYKYVFDNHSQNPKAKKNKKKSNRQSRLVTTGNWHCYICPIVHCTSSPGADSVYWQTLERRLKALQWYSKDLTAAFTLNLFKTFKKSAISDDEEQAPDYVIQQPAW